VDIERLRRLPEEELVRLHYEETQHRTVYSDKYLDELARREGVRQGERMDRLTRSIDRLAWILTGATILWVIMTALKLIIG
jgi:hypothetical protein